MRKGNKKKTTEEMIEELAVMIGRGFAATATKTEVEAMAQEMRAGFTATGHHLERIDFNTSGLGRRLDTIEERVLQLAKKVGLNFN